MIYWTNFAKSGDPNQPLVVPAKWPVVGKSSGSEQNIYFAQDGTAIAHQGENAEFCDFWDSIGYDYGV